jgi:hypothetical protein
MVFISNCTRKIGIEFKDEIHFEEEISDEIQEIKTSMYVNAPEGLRVRNSPSIDGDRIALLDNLTEVLVIGEDENYVNIDGISGKWTFIEAGNIRGYVFGGYLSTRLAENHGMNIIDAIAITFSGNNEKLMEFELIENEGKYRFEYGYNTVFLDYWKKNVEFDARYQYDNKYYPEEYIRMEKNIENGANDFNPIFFNQNIRENEINGIIFVDSFCFSVFESESIFLSRRIYLSTNNYNIRITIMGSSELTKKAIEETPNYFRIRTAGGNDDIEYNDTTRETGWVVWDYINDAKIMFGNDLINGIHKSKTVNDWFLETEIILSGIEVL